MTAAASLLLPAAVVADVQASLQAPLHEPRLRVAALARVAHLSPAHFARRWRCLAVSTAIIPLARGEEDPMFSVRQKRELSTAIQDLLRATEHPELPKGEITFHLHVRGATGGSWADILNNAAVTTPTVNPHNERQDPYTAPRRIP